MKTQAILTAVAVVLAGAGAAIAIGMMQEAANLDASRIEALQKERGVAHARDLAARLSASVVASNKDDLQRVLQEYRNEVRLVRGLRVVGADGTVLARAGEDGFDDHLAVLERSRGSMRRDQSIFAMQPISNGATLVGKLLLEESLKAKGDSLEASSRAAAYTVLLLTVLVLGLSIYLLSGRRDFPIEKVLVVTKGLVEGHLEQAPLNLRGEREIKELGAAIDQLGEVLRNQAKTVKAVANKVLQSSTQVMSATNQLTTAVTKEASAIAETTSTIEEIKQTGMTARQTAHQIVEIAEKSVTISGEGLDAVGSSVDEIRVIREQVEVVARGVEELRSQVGEVGDIITTVNDIAEQSNLLAVNASIEAAKAGKSGRGFAVVAQEVKNLAAQSKQATTQVRNTLGSIQQAIEGVFSTAQAARARTEAGVQKIEHTGSVISRLGEDIAKTAEGAKRIAVSFNEQVIGLEQVSQAMTSINTASAENLTSTKEVEKSGESLNVVVTDLQHLVHQFSLEG